MIIVFSKTIECDKLFCQALTEGGHGSETSRRTQMMITESAPNS